ncbi:hypothetical protein [Nocardioides aurantiacus]|uniref:Bacteriocin biosynthesis cyclodehydratase domain-containing protein n=1 Tax=Nocardioides aurantiacus TaxID=86796 RepID=A0A3N2CXV2_9ACTN|nr:hypothetical protein [Nocardioides aurantiacus]ROR92372.1 bacteriocin biosynthesis cyclodehydratase domain-containing protein [Nocardioides aurantiacus]
MPATSPFPLPGLHPDPYAADGRARLAPGLRVVRRGTDLLQVGLEPDRRVLLPRDPASAEVLHALRADAPLPTSPAARRVVHALLERGCLQVRPDAAPAAAVALLDDLAGDPDDPVSTVRLLEGAGVAVTPWTEGADAVLVRSRGECDRDRLDPLVRAGTPHLLLRLVDGEALLGPFVAPGLTCCLRCVDAHRAVTDPDHHAVTTRYVEAGARPREDGVPDLADPALVALVTAAAVREVAAYVRGEEPPGWSRTRRWTGTADEPVVQAWARHPRCGCSWAPDDHAWGTMGV